MITPTLKYVIHAKLIDEIDHAVVEYSHQLEAK